MATAAPLARLDLGRHTVCALAFGVLTVAYSWPLVLHMGTLVAADAGDPLLSMWTLWWNAKEWPFSAGWWHGPIFVPAPNTLTYSDHRVGLGLIASPVIWSGGSPVAAYNITFLASYVLSCLSAYLLAFHLSGSRTAAFLAGVIFGFHPFRAEHLAHLELLASYWLPFALLSLHLWIARPSPERLVAVASFLTLQFLTSGYYFVFSGVLIAAWLIWFVPWQAGSRRTTALVAALLAPFAALAPVLLHYWRAHRELGLVRSINEIEQFSADFLGFLTPPKPLVLWQAPESWYAPEGAVFPGVAAVAVVVIALILRRAPAPETVVAPRVRHALLVLAAVAFAGSAIAAFAGGLEFELAGLHLSMTRARKPFTVGVVMLSLWGATGPQMIRAWRARSVFAFYTLATAGLWAFALGPTGRLMGEPILYKAPYSWLMLLPGFADEFRAPARFAMLAALTLAIAAALALARLRHAAGDRRLALGAVVITSALAEGWVYPFPAAPLPSSLVIPTTLGADAVILELPIGVYQDAAAMAHAIKHGRPIANGLSGYDPPHYSVLRAAMRDGEFGALATLMPDGPLALFVDRQVYSPPGIAAIALATGAERLAATDTHDVLLVPAGRGPAAERGTRPSPAAVSAWRSIPTGVDLPRLADDNLKTAWRSGSTQQGDEVLVAELSQPQLVRGVSISLGPFLSAFPRELVIAVSTDGTAWQEVFRGRIAPLAVSAVLTDPLRAQVALRFAASPARYVRIAQTGRSIQDDWAIAELVIETQ